MKRTELLILVQLFEQEENTNAAKVDITTDHGRALLTRKLITSTGELSNKGRSLCYSFVNEGTNIDRLLQNSSPGFRAKLLFRAWESLRGVKYSSNVLFGLNRLAKEIKTYCASIRQLESEQGSNYRSTPN